MSDNLAYDARLAREKAQRRIRNLQAGIKSGKYRGQLQQEAQQQIKDLRRYMQQTRMKTKTGRTIKSHDAAFRREAVERLERMNVNTSYAVRRSFDNMRYTTQQINLASAGLPSKYSKFETQVFYRATQEAWDKPGISIADRNKAIAEHYHVSDFGAFVDKVLDMNRDLIRRYEANEAGQQQDYNEFEERLREGDNSDDVKYTEHIAMVSPAGTSKLELI